MVTNPADLVKVRQQLFVKAGSGRSPGFVHTLIGMVRKEGFFSIYNGVSVSRRAQRARRAVWWPSLASFRELTPPPQASMIRELSYSGIRMGCYDQFKAGILSLSPSLDPHSVIVKLGAGLGSGCLGAAIANPADVLKVRRQAVGGAALSLRGHAKAVYAEQGFKGFYRAVVPTVIR